VEALHDAAVIAAGPITYLRWQLDSLLLMHVHLRKEASNAAIE
jgi:hypothetical protein